MSMCQRVSTSIADLCHSRQTGCGCPWVSLHHTGSSHQNCFQHILFTFLLKLSSSAVIGDTISRVLERQLEISETVSTEMR